MIHVVLLVLALPFLSWGQSPQGHLGQTNKLGLKWEAKEVPGVESAWIHQAKPQHMITYVKNESTKNISFKATPPQQILAGLLGFRQLVYQQLGFTELKVSHFNFEASPVPQIELSGTYLRPDGVRVFFFETQRYIGASFEQYSYFIQAKTHQENPKTVFKLLKSLYDPARLPSSELPEIQQTEAFVDPNCADCQLATTTAIPDMAKEISKAAEKCAVDSWLFDPSKKSFLQENGIANKTESKAEIVARSFLTCAYGTISGSYKSIRDIVMAIPNILGFTWRGIKSAGSSVANFEYRKWLEDFSIQKVKDSAGNALTVTRDTVADSYQKASQAVYNGFQEGGVTGSIASVAQAAYNSSPHKAVGQFLSKVGSEVYSALSKEWTALGCMPTEALSQAVCQVAGYIITDLITGKLVLSGLSKAPKMRDAIAAVKAKMERVPIAGSILTRNLASVNSAECDKFGDKLWRVDSGFKLQGQDINVVQIGAKVLARGISPKSSKLECFEVTGSLAGKITERIAASELRAAKVTTKSDDFFSAGNSTYARSDDEFIEGINRRIDSGLSSRQARSIAETLSKNPQQMEHYGSLVRSVDDLKERLKMPGLTASESEVLTKTLNASEQTIKTLNETIPQLAQADRLNLQAISQTLKSATVTQRPEEVLVVNQALSELGRSIKRSSGNVDEAFDAWTAGLRKDRKHLTDQDLSDVKSCFIGPGVK